MRPSSSAGRVGEETVQLVAAVVTNRFSQQAFADSKANLHGYILPEKGDSLRLFRTFSLQVVPSEKSI